jgi:hypothetical protein
MIAGPPSRPPREWAESVTPPAGCIHAFVRSVGAGALEELAGASVVVGGGFEAHAESRRASAIRYERMRSERVH